MNKADEALMVARLENAMIYHLRRQSDLFSSKKTCAFHFVSSQAISDILRLLDMSSEESTLEL